jgi:hypothetical protein
MNNTTHSTLFLSEAGPVDCVLHLLSQGPHAWGLRAQPTPPPLTLASQEAS